jgi:hypothetical protein
LDEELTGRVGYDRLLTRGDEVAPWRRRNAQEAHHLMGGLYADTVSDQGAGSRRAQFWISNNLDVEERIRVALRDVASSDLPSLLAILRGERPGLAALEWTPRGLWSWP